MPDAVENEAFHQIRGVLLGNDRNIWLDPEDANEMARDLVEAGFRKVENGG